MQITPENVLSAEHAAWLNHPVTIQMIKNLQKHKEQFIKSSISNSTNFEFDPSGRDMINVVCDEALKPVTFLVVDKLNCSGESIKLGNNQVTRIKILGDEGRVFYRWCTMVGNIGFDITHRVSPTGSRATSKDDFSKEIEKIIISLSKD